MVNKKTTVIFLTLIILIVITVGIGYFSFFQKGDKTKNTETTKQELFGCLDEGKAVSYKIEEKESPLADVIIFVNDKFTEKELSYFKIENIRKNYHPIEIHRCGIYVIRMFNYDPLDPKQGKDYRAELWRYAYDGSKEMQLLFDGFSTDFRVDPTESYVALEWSYLDNQDYALVIKDLKTKKNSFVLKFVDFIKQYPGFSGNFGLYGGWSTNGQYFWGQIFDGANVLEFLRIEREIWKMSVFPTPPNVLGGDALNTDTGWLTVHSDNVWYGDTEFTEQEKAKRRAQGVGTELYIYNLFTGKRYFVDKIDEPLWFFKPQWFSDTELEYELPNGDKKVYNINL